MAIRTWATMGPTVRTETQLQPYELRLRHAWRQCESADNTLIQGILGQIPKSFSTEFESLVSPMLFPVVCTRTERMLLGPPTTKLRFPVFSIFQRASFQSLRLPSFSLHLKTFCNSVQTTNVTASAGRTLADFCPFNLSPFPCPASASCSNPTHSASANPPPVHTVPISEKQ